MKRLLAQCWIRLCGDLTNPSKLPYAYFRARRNSCSNKDVWEVAGMRWLSVLRRRLATYGATSSRSVIKLLSGSLIAQVILVGVSPILTRIYSPAELGTLAAFLALVGPVALLATGGYDQAVLLPDTERRAIELVTFVLTLVASVSVVVGIAVFAAVPALGAGGESLRWLYWLPLAVTIAGANSVLVAYANRQARYGLMASNSVIRSAAQAIGQVGVGAVAPTSTLLVGATTIASAVANVRLTRNYLAHIKGLRLSGSTVFAAAREYSLFPRYTLPAGLLSQTHLAGLPLAIGAIFGASTLGLWSIAQRSVATPLTVLGSAVSDVYFRRATEVRRSQGQSLRLYRRVLVRLMLISAPPFVLLALVAPGLFGVIFGPEWAKAGEYARIMIPWLWIRFLANPVSKTTLVFQRNRLGLWIQVSLATAVLCTVLVAWQLGWGFEIFLAVLSGLLSVLYALLLIIYGKVIQNSD